MPTIPMAAMSPTQMTSTTPNSQVDTWYTNVSEASLNRAQLVVPQTPATMPIFYNTRTTSNQTAYMVTEPLPLVNQAFSSYSGATASKSFGYSGA